jgi:hypothetical protein
MHENYSLGLCAGGCAANTQTFRHKNSTSNYWPRLNVSKTSPPDLSLFIDILHKLENIGAPYVIIGGFAAIMYGINRATYDIDIVVDLEESHIEALAEAYPLPRYYADPYQMRNAIRIRSIFNIIDTERGEKADLFPITMDERYRPALDNRVRQVAEIVGQEPLEVWAARPEDVIFGKLLAWAELQTERHASDIYEMMIAHYLGNQAVELNEAYIDQRAQQLGELVNRFWQETKLSAYKQAQLL